MVRNRLFVFVFKFHPKTSISSSTPISSISTNDSSLMEHKNSSSTSPMSCEGDSTSSSNDGQLSVSCLLFTLSPLLFPKPLLCIFSECILSLILFLKTKPHTSHSWFSFLFFCFILSISFFSLIPFMFFCFLLSISFFSLILASQS